MSATKKSKERLNRKKIGIILGSVFGGLALAFGGTIGIIAVVNIYSKKQSEGFIKWPGYTHFEDVNSAAGSHIGIVSPSFYSLAYNPFYIDPTYGEHNLFTVDAIGNLYVAGNDLSLNHNYKINVIFTPGDGSKNESCEFYILTSIKQTVITWAGDFGPQNVKKNRVIGQVFAAGTTTTPADHGTGWTLTGDASLFSINAGILSIRDTYDLEYSHRYPINVAWSPGNGYGNVSHDFTIVTNNEESYPSYSFSPVGKGETYGFAGDITGRSMLNYYIRIDTSDWPTAVKGDGNQALSQFVLDDETPLSKKMVIAYNTDYKEITTIRLDDGSTQFNIYNNGRFGPTAKVGSWYDCSTIDKIITIKITSSQIVNWNVGEEMDLLHSFDILKGVNNICLMQPSAP